MKKILSILLGLFLLTTPLAGCEKEETKTGYKLSEDGENITLSFGEETVFLQEISKIDGILLKPDDTATPELYVEEDGTKMTELFGLLSLEKVVLTETEEKAGKKVQVRVDTAYDSLQEEILFFSVTEQGAIEYYDGTAEKYYASKNGVTDYEELLSFCRDKQYEFPYQLTNNEGIFSLKNGEQTIFAYEEKEIIKMMTRIDSNIVQVEETARIERLLDSLFDNVNLRLNEGEYPHKTLSSIQYTFYKEQGQLQELFLHVLSNGRIYVSVGDNLYVSEINICDYETFISYFMEDYQAVIH